MTFSLAISVLNRIKFAGYSAFLVGGCVRDILLKRKGKDFDIATDATPDQVMAIFPHSQVVGEKFGVVLVTLYDEDRRESFEVATFRKEGAYMDKRRPSEVSFTNSSQEDSNRRDFTINAIYMIPGVTEDDHKFIDWHKGLEDINNKVIRCVGNPFDRFNEDALRMMRAVRFVAQLGFTLDAYTEQAICELSATIQSISQERVSEEFRKLLLGDHAVLALQIMERTGLLTYVCEELQKLVGVVQNKYHSKDVWGHTLDVIEYLQGKGHNELTMFGALFHDIGKPRTAQPRKDDPEANSFLEHEVVGADMVRDILTRMRFPSDFVHKVSRVVFLHMRLKGGFKDHVVRRMIYESQNPHTLNALLNVMEADDLSHVVTDERRIEVLARRNCMPAYPIFSPVLPIDGNDIIELGANGKEIGFAKDRVLRLWFKHPTMDRKEAIGCAKNALQVVRSNPKKWLNQHRL